MALIPTPRLITTEILELQRIINEQYQYINQLQGQITALAAQLPNLFGDIQQLPDTAIPDSSVMMWIDETTDNLTFRVRYSDTRLKTGQVALV